MPDAAGNLTLQDLTGGPLGQFVGSTAGVQGGLQQQALSQQMQQFMLALQFQQQQGALQQALNYGTQFGAAPGGNWMTWGQGGPTQPAPGTETQAALQQLFGQGTAAGAMTGYYNNPQTWSYPPGTYVRNAQTGQIGQIMGNGQLQVGQALPPGLNPNQIQTIDQSAWNPLLTTGGGGQGAPLTTQAAIAQQQALAAQQAGVTGYYNQPMGNIAQDAFQKAGPSDQATYLRQYGNDPAQAAQHYWQDVQGAIQNAGLTPQQFVYGTTGPTPTLANQLQYATLYGAGMPGTTAAGQQTLQAINQAAQLSGMYQGAPTEATREFNQQQLQQLAEFQQGLQLQQGQLGQQYLSTAAQLQGPQNTFQLSNYLRGAQGNPNVPVYLQNLQNNLGLPSFQAPGTTTPTPQSAAGLTSQMGYGVNGTPQYDANGNLIPATTQGAATSATPGWNYNQTLNTVNQIAQRGAQTLAPGSLERLNPDELAAFGSGLGAAGYSLPSFLSQYAQSRVGQQAPVSQMSLAA